ncbi:glucose-6-phosphate dehydrogenase [Paenibacillus sp. 481]|uniref:glucose-6-phosphate dehydrogenase n=1 Tax=Paenibacillus sp. 481 TaxID=2835869 RepID=UPI001E334486|nr:glucose-6-phosphate dehydrogenase [Paenibacillus sp. 481]UHA71778.1 glucose-6-phosphate dehydrogenase [Paenibacillus sp. 481]
MDAMTFVLFGATGDLAKRKIFPALYNLYVDQKMPQAFSVIGLGRSEVSNEQFQANVAQSLATFSRREVSDETAVQSFLDAFRYVKHDATNPEDYHKLLGVVQQRERELNIPENRLFYLSVAPQFFDVIANNLKESGLGTTQGWKRLVIEKPFGHDLQSARELNAKLSHAFAEEEVYRIDHYLGKSMVKNLEVLESSNPVLKALWSNRYIANVQITASETVGVEERAAYYDKTGAIRDMFQNHMLQLLMMTAMQLPTNCTPDQIRFKKKKVLEALRPLNKEEVRADVIRGQYAAGEIQGEAVVAYTSEPGVEASSLNDTFIAARLWIDDPFWKDVPFFIRTGKRMKEKSTRIVIEFKNPLDKLQADADLKSNKHYPNLLTIQINPNESITLQLNSKNPLKGGEVEPIQMNFSLDQHDLPEAYENLIFDALRGDVSFFTHWDEVELAWKWVQPILEAFADNTVPLHTYPAGSFGPEASDQLLEQEGAKWWQ